MAKVIHYIRLEDKDQVFKLTKELESLRKDDSLNIEVAAACSRIIEKAIPGRYLILDGTYQLFTGQVIFNIQNASVWNCRPQSYANCIRDDYRTDLPKAKVQIEYNKFLEVLKSIFNTNSNSNSQKDGKDQDQLQGEANSDSGRYEGSILYCGRNRPQLAAGRHCDQAGIKIKGTRIGGSKIYLSSRCPEVLVTPQRDRFPEGRSSQSERTPGGTRVQCDCSYFIDDDGSEITIRMKSDKSDCNEIGDSYIANDGIQFILTGWDNLLGHRTARFSMVRKN